MKTAYLPTAATHIKLPFSQTLSIKMISISSAFPSPHFPLFFHVLRHRIQSQIHIPSLHFPSSLSRPYLLACVYACLFLPLCIFTPLSLSFAIHFFPYRSIKHSFCPLLSDVSPSTSIHLLLTLSLPILSWHPSPTTTTSLALTAIPSIFLHMRFA